MIGKSMLIVSTMLATALAVAQEGPISAERPSYSSSPFTLAPGRWQVEFGYQYANEGGNDDSTVQTLPLALLRVGLTDRLEVQLNWAGYNEINSNAGNIDGSSDALLGVKWQLTEDDAGTPVGLFAGVSLPIGSDAFSSGDRNPAVGVFWSHSGLADFFGTVDATFAGNSRVLHNAIGINLPVSNNVGTFIEYVGTFPESSGPLHNLIGGITFLKNHDMQLDLNVGVGLNSRAADFTFGFGAAQRF